MKRIQRHAVMSGLGFLAMCTSGCLTWESSSPGRMWESGKAGSAAWKTNAGRGALGEITVVERYPTREQLHDADYIETSYNAIGHLLATSRPNIAGDDAFDSTLPVIYSTTVDLNDYDKTTNFGRVMAESLATALTQHWRNKVIKMTLRQGSSPIVPREGEFLLSREAVEIASDFNAGAVLVSTYSVSIDKVYVNLELINVHHNAVVAATMFDIPLGPRTMALLKNREFPDDAGDILDFSRVAVSNGIGR